MSKKREHAMTLAEKMEMVRMSVRAVTREYKISRLITGQPGIGKSFSVIEELKNEEANYVHITGGIKDAEALYLTLYKHNHQNMIVVFDDVNDIIRKRQCVEILRAAVTNEPERKIIYVDNPTKIIMKGTKAYNPWMTFKSKVIVITNIPKAKIDTAILSRTSPIEIFASKQDVAEYIEQNLEAAPPQKVSLEWKHEVWNYIKTGVGYKNIRHIDFRLFEDVMLWKAATSDSSDPDMWKKYAFNLLT